MNEAWLIYEDDDSYYGRFRAYTDEIMALEAYMNLIEEDMYLCFIYCLDDELEDRSPEEIAKSITFKDSLWRVQKCPIY